MSHPRPIPGSDPAARDLALIEAARVQAAELPSSLTPQSGLPPPGMFPNYQLIREIHRGGQGVVYLAMQITTRRKVAIKVMRDGACAGGADRARFEREIQILAQLKHPNIVGIHDSGVAEGCFFYVMDYISGRPLDAWIGDEPHPIPEVLRLFLKICDAIAAAHLKGVIHRDLKPGNVRVDASGEPQVVDFGLAKTIAGDAVDSAGQSPAMTMTGQFVGSLPWASPEQAEGIPDKIDVRTDVYSLGVVLYQLLTGRFPYQVAGNMRDVLDRILRAQPTRPSTVRRQIDDELETIVLKCLAKDRERRYQSAGELARDLRRYLAGEPVEAKRDSGWYLLKKTFERYRPYAALVALVALVAVASGAALWVKNGQLRARAVQLRAINGELTAANERLAESEAEANAANEAMIQVFEKIDPKLAQGGEILLREAMAQTEGEIDTLLAPYPKARGNLHGLFGYLFGKLGDPARGLRHAEAAAQLGAGGMMTGELIQHIANQGVNLRNRDEPGNLPEAERKLREAVRLMTLHPELVPPAQRYIVLNNLGRCIDGSTGAAESPERLREAEDCFRRAIDGLRREGAFDDSLIGATINLASLMIRTGRADQAREPLESILAEFPDPDWSQRAAIATAHSYLGKVLSLEGDAAAAEAQYRLGIDMMTETLGPASPSTIQMKANFAMVLAGDTFDRTAEAQMLMNEVVTEARAALSPRSLALARLLKDHGDLLMKTADYPRAVARLLDALDAVMDVPDPRAGALRKAAAAQLAVAYEKLGRPEEAARYLALAGGPATPTVRADP